MMQTSPDTGAAILWSFRRCPYAIRARLALAAAGVGVEVREEAAPDSGELFPHLYGGPLPCEAVVAAEPYRP